MQKPFIDKNGNIIDYYSIFNLPNHAETGEIQSAFRRLIKRYHPDTAGMLKDNAIEKINLIITGYRILIDEAARKTYDRVLFNSRKTKSQEIIIPKKRIKYSVSLSEMLKARMRPGVMKRKDIIFNFGQDIEILITQIEAIRGAVAYVDLPARTYCPLCRGRDSNCYLCSGIGRINTTSQLEVRIPPHVDNSTFIDIDLLKMKPDKNTSFTSKGIRIKITVMK